MDSTALTGLGVSPNAAKIYLAALALGTASVQELAKSGELKRPTAYGYIEELLADGLLERVPLGKREFYRATNPHVLQTRAEHRLEVIKKALPELDFLHTATEGRPGISVLEGEQGLRQVYEEMQRANSICFWSNLETFERRFHDVFQELSEAIQRQQIRTREILSNTPGAKKSAKRYAVTAGKSYSARLATVDGIQNDNAIYGNVVALFRLHENNLFVVRIEDATIAQTTKALFDMAWKNADPFIN